MIDQNGDNAEERQRLLRDYIDLHIKIRKISNVQELDANPDYRKYLGMQSKIEKLTGTEILEILDGGLVTQEMVWNSPYNDILRKEKEDLEDKVKSLEERYGTVIKAFKEAKPYLSQLMDSLDRFVQ